MADLTIGGETFNVLIEGDEALPLVMLCHPLGADLHIWDAQIPELTKHFRVLRYDIRGHGNSTQDGGPYSLRTLGRDALAILDAFEIDKAHVVGTSLGGAIAQWLLVNATARIERAVLANTAAQFGDSGVWNARILTAHREGMGALVEPTIKRWFSEDFVASQQATIETIRQVLARTSPEGYASACAALRDLDLRADLHAIEQQVLVIAGRDDLSVTADQAGLLADRIANAKLVTLETLHISNVGDVQGFTKAVVAFLIAKAPAKRPAPAKQAPGLPIARRPPGRRTATTRGIVALARPLPAKTPASKPKDAPARKTPAAAAPDRTEPKRASKRPAPKGAASTAVAAKRSVSRPRPTTKAQASKPAKSAAAKTILAKDKSKPSARQAAAKATAPKRSRTVTSAAPASKRIAATTTAKSRNATPALKRAAKTATPVAKTVARAKSAARPAPKTKAAPRKPAPKAAPAATASRTAKAKAALSVKAAKASKPVVVAKVTKKAKAQQSSGRAQKPAARRKS